jgi:tRNA(adenine34) deaminase
LRNSGLKTLTNTIGTGILRPVTGRLNNQISELTLGDNYIKHMFEALKEAGKAAKMGEVPVGAVLMDCSGNMLSKGHNQAIRLNDPTAHAEIVVIRKAANLLINYRTPCTTLYVTVEPCLMCAGALLQARVKKLVFGASDPKGGVFGSLYNIAEDTRFNHKIEVVSGVLSEECGELMRRFFRIKR